jgi:uncharacterized repeat protein (TIGR03803 family)
VLHAFGTGADGGGLWSPVVLDGQGNVYGTTSGGGLYGAGTVYRLTRQSNGVWSESIIHSFLPSPSTKGDGPFGGPILDLEGKIYGTTAAGGGPNTYGLVYKLVPDSNGGWGETVLRRFGPLQPAGAPQSSLIMDASGNLYGGAGAVFELSPTPTGWKETVLHSFVPGTGDGWGVLASPTLDAAGNVYGTTEHGGTSTRCGGGCGTVYEIQHLSNGSWKESVLHSFRAYNDGAFPGFADKLAIDAAGNLYGTADGGASGLGVIFRMSRGADGVWTETLLHTIGQNANGNHPSSGVVMDKAGNLYGVTIAGGTTSCDCGVVYKLSPGANGTWTYTVLHRFTGSDGAEPDANLTLDANGNIYGTTATGGAGGAGVVFEITP